MVATQEKAIGLPPSFTVTWDSLPKDYPLPEEPVENTGQPLLAGALRESLELAERISTTQLIASNLGICATVNGELTLKAPDWLFVPQVHPLAAGSDRKSYTPHREGQVPSIVMEFLSETDGGEYSHRRIPPIGKWFFYEQVLKVLTYIIFEPEGGLLEVYRHQGEQYQLEQPNPEGWHWFAELGLFLGTWRGEKEGRSGYWLRWWDEAETRLPWAVELMEQERQRAERLADYLRSQGINPDDL